MTRSKRLRTSSHQRRPKSYDHYNIVYKAILHVNRCTDQFVFNDSELVRIRKVAKCFLRLTLRIVYSLLIHVNIH